MYDTIHCKMPLPIDWEVSKSGFQTKNLGCHLDTYTIFPSGMMIKQGRDFGSYRILDLRIPLDGTFEFNDYGKNPTELVTMKAVFVDGICLRIELVDRQVFDRSLIRWVPASP